MIHQLIKIFGDRFYSLRFVPKKNIVSLDLKIPVKWVYESILVDYVNIEGKLQDESEDNVLISLLSTYDEDKCSELMECGRKIVKFNLEQEEKTKLFEQKVNELRELFLNTPLEKLKEIGVIDGQENADGDRVAKQRNKKRQSGDNVVQEESDRGVVEP